MDHQHGNMDPQHGNMVHQHGNMDPQHGNMERFLKLGYSHGDILRVLESLRHDAQTNDILEELIKTCRSHRAAPPAGPTANPLLVPRGCGSPRPTSPRPGSAAPGQPPRPGLDREPGGGFRPVVIDGSNVAMSHGDKRVFSCHGLQLAVKWFWDRGARDITVFVPLWRKEQPRPEAPITDQHILHELERRKILVFTPSRCVNGKRVVCYDDRYIIKLAFDSDGIIVSNDNYRDLQTEKPLWKKFIEERLLMYSFVNDKFMPPDDPLGRNGPTIDNFLRKKSRALDNKQQHCPYGKKCTYGVKCKFYHPERANQSQLSVADELRAMSSRPGVDREQTFVPPLAPSHRVGPDSRPYSAQNLYRDLEHTALPHRYSSSPLVLRTEEQPHRASPSEQFVSQRDTGSPVLLPSLRLCPSPDSDEAFGSLDSSMSKLQMDMSKGTERLSYAYSSGVAGSTQGSGDFHLSGSYNTNAQRLSVGGPYAPPRSPPCGHNRSQTCEHSSCNQYRYGPQHAWPRPPPVGSYGAHIPNDGDGHGHLSDQQYFRHALPYRVGNSLPEGHWGQGSHSDGELTSGAKTAPSEQRRTLRSQLSTLYPRSLVEQVMCSHPHVMDMSELLPLIQRYRNHQVSF